MTEMTEATQTPFSGAPWDDDTLSLIIDRFEAGQPALIFSSMMVRENDIYIMDTLPDLYPTGGFWAALAAHDLRGRRLSIAEASTEEAVREVWMTEGLRPDAANYAVLFALLPFTPEFTEEILAYFDGPKTSGVESRRTAHNVKQNLCHNPVFEDEEFYARTLQRPERWATTMRVDLLKSRYAYPAAVEVVLPEHEEDQRRAGRSTFIGPLRAISKNPQLASLHGRVGYRLNQEDVDGYTAKQKLIITKELVSDGRTLKSEARLMENLTFASWKANNGGERAILMRLVWLMASQPASWNSTVDYDELDRMSRKIGQVFLGAFMNSEDLTGRYNASSIPLMAPHVARYLRLSSKETGLAGSDIPLEWLAEVLS